MLDKMGLDTTQKLHESVLKMHMTGMAVAGVVVLLGGYTAVFGALYPGFSYVDAFYFTFDTFTTIGFGALAPILLQPSPASADPAPAPALASDPLRRVLTA